LILCSLFAAGHAVADDPPRTRLLTEHVDVAVLYQPDDLTNKLAVVVRDDDHGREYQSNEVALVVGEAAKLTLPPGTIFGEGGEPLWVLPQTQNPAVLYVGLSGDALPRGVFETEVALRLLAVEGPGEFFLWQAGAFGEFEVWMNSADGISAEDLVLVPALSHGHFNWGFTTNGTYDVVLEAVGQRLGVATNDVSLPTAWRFEVEPLPPEPERPFVTWQQQQWPGVTDPDVIGPSSDPDVDVIMNAVDYALGLNPQAPGDAGWPVPVVVVGGIHLLTELHFRTPQTATDVEFLCWRAQSLTAPIWERLPGPEPSGQPVSEGLVPLRFAGGVVAPSQPVYLRFEVRLVH